ncbi:MAG: menaquinone biosynthesis protein [Lewinellaceae bacterium]|nr:menaquinone biosynthesis protein [Lewinellaceae bacterium]
MEPLNVTAVSYLNTKPFLYGIFRKRMEHQIHLELDIPSICARKLASGEADLGLVPVAVLPSLPTPHLVSDYCIGAIGAVKTVCVFSEAPIDRITHLYLDYHSRTSVELVQILLREHWKVSPVLIPAQPGFEQQIQGTHAALIIGDRAIGQEERYSYVYDLGQAWMDFTGLPFVFAAWVSNKPLDPGFIAEFNEALKAGIESIPQLIYLIPPPSPTFDLETYFTRYISYPLDEEKQKGLELFLRYLDPRTTFQASGRLFHKI